MLATPRNARMAACAVLLLGAGVVANVAFLQGQPRERRVAQIPVGLATPLPETRRGGGPVTLSLASLIEATTPPTAPAQSVPQQTVCSTHRRRHCRRRSSPVGRPMNDRPSSSSPP